MQTTSNTRRAFTLVELLLVMLLVAVLVAMMIPAPSGKRKAQRINCVNNLKQIATASILWANDNTNTFPTVLAKGGAAYRMFQAMSNNLVTPTVLYCFADSKKRLATNFFNLNNSNIAYFIGLDATGENPQSVLLGDDNLVVNGTPVRPGILNLSTRDNVEFGPDRHHFAGNIALADGSVWQVTRGSLREMASSTNSAMTRLVIP